MARYKKNEILEISWYDVEHDPAWKSEKSASEFKLPECKSIGYFLNQNKGCIRLSCTLQTNKDKDRDVIIIPRGMIFNIRRLSNETTQNSKSE